MDDRRARRGRDGRRRRHPLPARPAAPARRRQTSRGAVPRRVRRRRRQRRAADAGGLHALRRGAGPLPKLLQAAPRSVVGRARDGLRDPDDHRARRPPALAALRGGDALPGREAGGVPSRRLGAPGNPLARAPLEPDADPSLRRRRRLRPGREGRRQGRHPARRVPPDRRGQGGSAALPQGRCSTRRGRRRPRRLRARGHQRPNHERQRPSTRPRGHRPGPHLRIAHRPTPGGRRIRIDRQCQSPAEGDPRPCRRTGPRAGRRPLVEASMGSDERPRESIDDLDALLSSLPPEIVAAVHALPDRFALIEVVMDLGRRPEARFPDSEESLLDREITEADIAFVVDHIGTFGDDNRAGIERTLHRISAIRNRNGKIEIINDFVETGKSILIMGRPGIGKTTVLREAARVLADDMGKRVVVVDTSNEIAGDGDIPHPAIGKARRMQVRTPSMQHEVMIEAVENHMPQVIVIDEIGTELEAQAARTIAERGVQLIGTAHGNNLDNLMLNPTLSDLIGGIQSVTLGDEEARRRRTQKSVLERKAPPTFDVIVEIQDRERVVVHSDVAETVDAMLRGDPVAPELRWRDEEGVHRSQGRPRPSPREQLGAERFAGLVGAGTPWRMEPGWRGDGGSYRTGGYREAERGGGFRPGYRPGAAGGWRQSRGGSGREPATRGPASEGGYP